MTERPAAPPPARPIRLARAARIALRVALLAALPAQLAAQEAVPADSAARADSARARRLAPRIITGTRLTAADDAHPTARVDAVEIGRTARGPAAAAEALASLPGVSMFDDQGARAQPTLEVRGFTLSPVVGVPQGVSVFLDGVRVNEPDAQQVHFDLLPIGAVARAELVRGPTALFGKNTLAGALNISTVRGADAPRREVELEAGAFGQRGAHVLVAGERNGFDGMLSARVAREDGYRTASDAVTRLAIATAGHRGRAHDVAVTVMAARDRIRQPGSLPESWLRVDRRANYTAGDFFEPRLLHLSARGERALARAELRGNVFARRNDTEQYNVNVEDPDTRAFVRSRSAGFTTELSVPLAPAGVPVGVTVGAEYSRNAVRYHVFNEPNEAAPTLPPDCDADGLCEDARVVGDDAAAYAQLVAELGRRVSVTGSVRGDWVRIPFRDLREPANDGTHLFRRLTPRLGASVLLAPGVRAHVAAGAGFRAPAALELACADENAPCPLPFSLGADPPLAAVTLRNYETGLAWRPDARTSVTIDAFRADVRNEIVFTASETAAGFFRNVPRTRRTGLELSAAAGLPANVRLFGTYGWLDAEYRSRVTIASAIEDADDARPGDRFPLSPTHRGSAGIGITRLLGRSALDAEIATSAVSSQFLRGDDANDHPPVPGYAVTRLRVSVERSRLTATVHVSNLFDRRYETFGIYAENPRGPLGGEAPEEEAVERFLNPGLPRAVSVSLRASF